MRGDALIVLAFFFPSVWLSPSGVPTASHVELIHMFDEVVVFFFPLFLTQLFTFQISGLGITTSEALLGGSSRGWNPGPPILRSYCIANVICDVLNVT